MSRASTWRRAWCGVALVSASAWGAGETGGASAPLAAYFSSGRAQRAVAHLARREHAACARELTALLDEGEKAHATQARFLLAYCQVKAGLPGAAAAFDALQVSYPLLADYARLYGAEALLASGHYEEALRRAKAVTAGSPLKAEADLTVATTLDRAGRASEAADAYVRYLAAYPSSWRAGEVRGRHATALEVAGRSDEAKRAWRASYVENPITLGAKAEPRLDPAQPLTADELARRADVLFDAMKNKDSELAWAKVLAVPDLAPQLACKARYNLAQSVWKQRDRARAAPLFEDAAMACELAKDADLGAKSLYQAGRSHGSRAEKDKVAGEKAIALYQKLMASFPTHSYADDAALRRADVLDTLGRKDEGSAALAAIPEQFPAGDQRGEALFRLAFRAFETGDAKAARGWLEHELAILPREEGWWEAGRTLYWLGRSHATLGDTEQAHGYYQRAVREYPMSYYALLAVNRLLAGKPEDAERVLAEVTRKPGPVAAVAPVDRPQLHSEAFKRGVELLALGLGPEARRELAAAGLESPRRGTALPADRELGWIASRWFESAGDWSSSHAYGRYVDTEFMRKWPLTDALEQKWRLAFPRAYEALVEESVKNTGQPAALELAIMREESAFDPNLESFANAVGLTQLTAPPAARFADGLPHDAQALRDPAINLAIGARELGQLYAAFDKNPALAIASYNAGEGAVRRWLRDPANKGRELDEFVERIPYDETRGYTKRVLGTYFTYAWLEVKEPALARVPRLDFPLPGVKKR